MSWFTRLLSPKKRRAGEDFVGAQPTKRSRSLLPARLFSKEPSTPVQPYDNDDLVSYDAQSGDDLGPLLLR